MAAVEPRVSAVLIATRARLANLAPILDRVLSCPDVGEILVDIGGPDRVWGRWRLADKARYDLVYVQDDDCLVDVGELLARYDERPGVPVCRIAKTHWAFVDSAVYNTKSGLARLGMVGWGAVLPRLHATWAIEIIKREFSLEERALVLREADRIVTVLWEALRLIECDVDHLPGSDGPDALSHERDHIALRREAIERAVAIRQRM